MPDKASRIAGGILGLLVGDALGVPYEFHDPRNLPPRDRLAMVPPPKFPRAHASVSPGTWSDDGAQALCLLASLLDRDSLDLADFAGRLIAWYEDGYMAVGGHVFDIGGTTADALAEFRWGVAPARAGSDEESSNGNGSLMRVLPLVLWHTGSDKELVRDAELQSCVTHRHRRARVCCALYCLWARYVLEDSPDPWGAATGALRRNYQDDEEATRELEGSIRPDDPPGGAGSGYVVDCLRSARWAVGEGFYPEAVLAAISLGRDTDTTACVAGGLAGVRDGVEAIPAEWLQALRGRELVDPLLVRLLARVG